MKTFTAKAFEKPTIYLILLVCAAYIFALPAYGAGDHASVTVTITFLNPVKFVVSQDSLDHLLSDGRNENDKEEDGSESPVNIRRDDFEVDRVIVGSKGEKNESSNVSGSSWGYTEDSIDIYFDPSI